MERVSISKLKDQLSAYLKKVQAGETVVVMDRGTPVARLVRMEAESRDEARYQKLVTAGVIRSPRQPFDPAIISPVDLGSDAKVVEALLEERREGW